MKAIGAGLTGVRALLLVIAISGLAGCASVDDALFGGTAGSEEQATAPAPDNDQAAAQAQAPEAAPEQGTMAAEPPVSQAPMAAPAPMVAGAAITAVPIEAGTDTGTAVSHTIAGLRSDLQGVENAMLAHAQQLRDLRNSAAQSVATYQQDTGSISARLQIGTTRGNPELVNQWNAAQSALDALTTNINALNALGTQIADNASHAHFLLSQVQAAFNVSGAVDEDHRQLAVLEDETDQTIVLIDRIVGQVSDTVQRQTAFVANERASLTTLASGIKNGELYGGDLGVPMTAGPPTPASGAFSMGGTPLVTIKFDHPGVKYQQVLYTALSEALQSRPAATFDVVGVSPSRGTAAAVQIAQTDARRRAREVMRSMGDMGVPQSRMGLSSTSDPRLSASEVRVFVR
jgi:hypothetical protein